MKIGYFEELTKGENIKKSLMRLMNFLSFCIAGIYSILVKLFCQEIQWYDVLIILLFLIGAFAPKAMQKIAENKLLEK